jgi:uncharacterized circularly permuted ATP-grasp superfamily protein
VEDSSVYYSIFTWGLEKENPNKPQNLRLSSFVQVFSVQSLRTTHTSSDQSMTLDSIPKVSADARWFGISPGLFDFFVSIEALFFGIYFIHFNLSYTTANTIPATIRSINPVNISIRLRTSG